MLSKEEIENKIYSFHKYMRNQAEDEIMQEYWEDIKQYIEQLESREQKLIEKLEKYTNNTKKEKLPYFKTVSDMIKYKGYAEGRIETCEEILSIVKGENHE